MFTKGNYKIENFKKLDVPIKRGILEPHIYSGKVLDLPNGYNKGTYTCEITWDKFGRCSNWLRQDCFIDVSKIKV